MAGERGERDRVEGNRRRRTTHHASDARRELLVVVLERRDGRVREPLGAHLGLERRKVLRFDRLAEQKERERGG
jgi:hypothetical protein